MRFVITRLCGGKALMLSSTESYEMEIEKIKSALSKRGEIKSFDEMMVVSQFGEMEITVYPQGKIMFHPLEDKDVAIKYATEIFTDILG